MEHRIHVLQKELASEEKCVIKKTEESLLWNCWKH